MLYYVLAAIGGIVVGLIVGMLIRKAIAEKKIGSAEAEAKRILEDAAKAAETAKKEKLVEAKEEALKIKNETERELKERRNDLQRMERRAMQKEENLDKKYENLEKKVEVLNNKIRENDALKLKAEEIVAQQEELLQKISGMTAEDARAVLMERVESEARHEMAMKLLEVEQECKDKA
ncbi:MAG: DUF3552 domain-containing protein, partial [Clostridia bacterium]|nr:DUF3552 domain-containing protein [Clostridia bacterium]